MYSTELGLVYSCGSLTVGSVVGMYLMPDGIAVVDKNINQSVMDSLKCKRCRLYYYNTNDEEDLRVLLESLQDQLDSFTSKYLILEGIQENTGRICKLPQLIEVAKRFKFRIILDESFSFGVLGPNGVGVLDYYGLNLAGNVDLVCGSLEYAFGTLGGFCVGEAVAVENQYIHSLSFVYSASLSAFLVQSILSSLEFVKSRSQKLKYLSREVHDRMFNQNMNILSDADSPLKVFKGSDSMVDICRESYGVYMFSSAFGICMNLHYDICLDIVAKERLFQALCVFKEISQ